MAYQHYFQRSIDESLRMWADSQDRKSLLLRGARQVGKSSAVRHLGEHFEYFVEVNFERDQQVAQFFSENIDIKKICSLLAATYSTPIIGGRTLLFLDEIQACPNAIRALRYFYEDYPELHVVAAGSLLEFALAELPSFGVGRIQSLFMYPFSFGEFLDAIGKNLMHEMLHQKHDSEPLPDAIHSALTDDLRTFMLIGGMPDAVKQWVLTNDYLRCQAVNADILQTYLDDFSKYNRRVSPVILQQTLLSVAQQAGQKFMYQRVIQGIDSYKIKDALELLTMAGLIIPVTHSAGNGVPLGAETNEKFHKYLMLDTGLMLAQLGVNIGEYLLADNTAFVCKGALAEVFAGLEILKSMPCSRKQYLYYWQNLNHGTQAEVDYLIAHEGQIMPVEVKAGTKGSMKSMYSFLQIKNLRYGIRTSLENFGELPQAHIIPLYALAGVAE